MSRERFLIIFGLLVLLAPFVGLPLAILSWVLPVLGAAVAFIGVSYAMRKKGREPAVPHPASEVIERY